MVPHCLIIDDDMGAYHCAQAANIKCTPCTHFELISQKGQQHFRKLHTREYNMLWITIPLNYFYRTPPPGTAPKAVQHRFSSHQSRLLTFLNTARMAGCHVSIFGQPGRAWVPYQHDLDKLHIKFHQINMCSIDQCFNRSLGKPSRAHLLLATTYPVGNNWGCSCKTPKDGHILDWFGDEDTRTEYRQKARGAALASIWQAFSDKVIDLAFPSPLPPPTLQVEALPTEARIQQKERHKLMKERGEKPKRIKQHVEDGHDDCGDDVSGLGPEVHLLGLDGVRYTGDYMSECWDSESD